MNLIYYRTKSILEEKWQTFYRTGEKILLEGARKPLIMDPRDTRADFPRLALETVSRIDTRGKVKVEDKPGLCGIESSPSR